ncbi:MAG: CoA-binding protein, partial [Planctomycetota bacterium]
MSECEVRKYRATDSQIKEILTRYENIAIVGVSGRENRPSFYVAKFLLQAGYKVIFVNPNYENILGLKCYRNLSEIKEKVEIVDIFRRAEQVKEIVDEAILIGAKVIWMQEGIINKEACDIAREKGLEVVMDRCM